MLPSPAAGARPGARILLVTMRGRVPFLRRSNSAGLAVLPGAPRALLRAGEQADGGGGMTDARRREDVERTIALWISDGLSAAVVWDALEQTGVASWGRVRDLMLCHARAFERGERPRRAA